MSGDTMKFRYVFNYTDLHAQCHRFRPKRNHFRCQTARWRKFGHTGCSSIAKCSQNSCRNDAGGFRCWPPATCRFSTRKSFDHHGKGKKFELKRKDFWTMKKKWNLFVSLIHLKVMITPMTARLSVTMSSVQTWFYGKKFLPGSTQLPPSRHLLSLS